MRKLGLVITKTFGGYAIVFQCNTTPEWMNSVCDVRILTPNNQGERTVFLKYVESGVLIGLVRDYPGGRVGDNFTAWLHIPSEIRISGEEIVALLETLDGRFKNSDYDFSQLTSLFEKEYPEVTAKRVISVPAGGSSAVKFFGEASLYKWGLSDILDSKYLYQPEYLKYKYIVFLDDKERSSVYPNFECIADLPAHKESVVVNPPAEIDGFKPYVNDVLFDKPIMANKGETLTVVWKKHDYKDIQVQFTAGDGPIPSIQKKDYLRFVNPSRIHVNSKSTGNAIKQAKIYVQGRLMKEGEGMYLPEYQYTRADILVQHTYYEECRVCGRNLEEDVIICLEDKFFTYNFVMPLKDSTEAEITIPSKTILMETPFEGYVLANSNLRPSLNDNNRLKYRPNQGISKPKFIISCALSLLVGLLIGVGIMLLVGYNTEVFQNDDPVEDLFVNTPVHPVEEKDSLEKAEARPVEENKAENKAEIKKDSVKTPAVVVTPTDAKLIAEALEYLNSNPTWYRDEMEKYPKLKGLWDDLNNKNFKTLGTKYKYLMKSSIFKSIVEAAGNFGESTSGTYNSPDDFAITPARYLEYLTSRAIQN